MACLFAVALLSIHLGYCMRVPWHLTAVLAIVFAAVGYVAQLIATFAQIGVLFALLMCTPLLFIAITATVTLMANSCRRSLGALTTGVAFVLLRGGRSSWDIGGTLWLFFMAIAPNHTTGNYDGLAAILLWLLALVVFPALLLVPGVLISVTGLITLFAADQPRSNDVATPLWTRLVTVGSVLVVVLLLCLGVVVVMISAHSRQ
mmetsp:Transcript_675/g.2395  ORF Transcript_675/g.2395 Transcript_675/m.2395 type:complete len:204 (+) Transcript_675:1025-1636(+)